MNYQFHYNKIIKRGKKRQITGYVEKHHVIPKCLGGGNEKDNIVVLTPEEHFLAHQLLTKIFPENKKLIAAAVLMCCGNQFQKRNNKLYGWLRRSYSSSRKGQTKENNASVRAMSEKLKGRTKETHDYLRRSSKQRKGQTKENNASVRAMSEKLKGRTKETHVYLKEHSEKMRGRTKETHEGNRRQSKKLRGRTKENNASVRAMSEKLKGRTKETHDGIRRQSKAIYGRCKINEDQRNLLFDKRSAGLKYKDIVLIFDGIGIKVTPDFLRKIYERILSGKNFK